MSKLFISHSSHDDAFVREVQQALTDLKQDVWIDSRELRGGDPLESAIQSAINDASAFAVLVSTHAFQSKWVGKELRIALDVQRQRGRATISATARERLRTISKSGEHSCMPRRCPMSRRPT